jgi:parvulin-like peptidyl-prolyl isomerase
LGLLYPDCGYCGSSPELLRCLLKRYSAAIGAVVLVLASCGGSSDGAATTEGTSGSTSGAAATTEGTGAGTSDAAATVNGNDISAADVEGLLFDKGEEFGDDQFTQLLDVLVQWNAIADAAKTDFEIEPTEDEVATRVDQLHAEQGQGLTFEEYLAQQNISEEGLDLYAGQLVIGAALLEELGEDLEEPTEDEARQLLAEDPMAWTQVCAAHILVATSEEADAIVVRLDAGEEFAALAIETSIDTGSGSVGGDLGCTSPSGYVPEFAEATMTAELGEIAGPVESQFGFHLIRVDSRTEATIEQLEAGASQAALGDVVDEWYLSSIVGADVTINETWGTWETEPTPGIVPPA